MSRPEIMAVDQDFISRLLKLAIKQGGSDGGMLLVYHQGLFWLTHIASMVEDGSLSEIRVERSNFHLDLNAPFQVHSLHKCTLLPISVLALTLHQGRAVDWPWVTPKNQPLLWPRPGEAMDPDWVYESYPLEFVADPHLARLQGRSLCCLPLVDGDEWHGLLYLEGVQRTDPLSPDQQQRLSLLAEQLQLAIAMAGDWAELKLTQDNAAWEPTLGLASESPLDHPQLFQSVMDLLMQKSPLGLALCDRQGRYLLASETWRYIYNLQNTNLWGRFHQELCPHQPLPGHRLYSRCLAGEGLHCDEELLIHTNGHIDWIRWQLYPWYHPNLKTIGGVLIMVEVITDRKKQDIKIATLQQSLESTIATKTQALVRANQELALEVELNQRITQLAKRFVEVPSDRVDEEILMALEDLGRLCEVDASFLFQFADDQKDFSMTHEWCEQMENRCLAMAQNIPRRKFPWSTVRLCQGQSIHIPDLDDLPETATIDRLNWERFGLTALLVVPLRFQGKTLGWFGLSCCGRSHDWSPFSLRLLESVGEIFTYALQQQKIEFRLRDQEERLRLALESTHLGVWEEDLQPPGQLHWSPEMEKLFGFAPQTFDGQMDTFLSRVHPDDRVLIRVNQRQTLRQGEGSLEYRIVIPDQGLRWISRRYRVFYNGEGTAVSLLGIDEDVTQRRQAEEERDRFFALSDDLCCIASMDGFFHQVNPAFERVLGHSPAEIKARPYVDWVHPDDRDMTIAAANALLQGQVITNLENRYQCKDGSYRWLSWSSVPYPSEGLVYAVARDITAKNAADQALKDSEARFQAIAQNIPGVIYRYELYPDGRDAITYANAGSLDIWELPPDALMENICPFWSQVHPNDLPAMQAKVLQSAQTLSYWIWEWRLINPSGKIRWVRGGANPQRREDGTIVWDGIILDITDPKHMEEALQKSEAQYRRIVETTSEGIWLMDGAEKTTFVNAQMAAMLGYRPEEMLGKSFFDFMDDDQYEFAQHSIERRHQNIAEQHDFKFRCKGGEELWVLISSQPFFDEAGHYQGSLGMLTDITERKKAEEQLRQYERIVSTTSDSIALISRNYQYQLVNQSYCTLVNKSYSDIVGRSLPDVLGENFFQDKIKSLLDDCLRGHRVEYSYWDTLGQGDPLYQSVVYTPYLDSNGGVSGILASIRDFTAQKQIEDELLVAKARYQTFLETTLEGFLVVSFEPKPGIIVEVNPAYCHMTGYLEDDLLGMNIENLIFDGQGQDIQDRLKQVVAQGSYYFEGYHYCKTGTMIDLSLSLTYEPERQVVFAFIRDITEKKQAELALRQSEIHLKTIINTTSYGILILNHDGKILFVNQAAIELFGRSEDKLVGEDFGIPIIHGQDVEMELVRPSGEIAVIEIRVAHIAWEQKPALFISLHDVTDRKKVEQDLRFQAVHDTLTGLPNRAFLMERLEQALGCQQFYPSYAFAVLFIDLDRFKIINDSLGHLAGDQLLVEVAQRLQKHMGSLDTVARLGGDEFVILLENIVDFSVATDLAIAIKQEFRRPIRINKRSIFTTVSIGIALSSQDYKNSLEILRDADNAMYQAKRQGKDRYQVFDPTMYTAALRSLDMESNLWNALNQEEFQLYYQPIVCLTTFRVIGFEALLRWRHPSQGLISPTEFIPLAEETGLIVPLGEWILHQACQHIQLWEPDLDPDAYFRVSVNLSGRQLQLPDFCDRMDDIIGNYPINTKHLKFEITETVLINNIEEVTIALEHFKSKNIQISIDDFGTGCSSLSYLHQMPINTLKIDKSFVQDMRGGTEGQLQINAAIVTLAHALGMTVVAEGVETQTQIKTLQSLGCEFGQGYIFSPAVAVSDASHFVRQKFIYPTENCPRTMPKD